MHLVKTERVCEHSGTAVEAEVEPSRGGQLGTLLVEPTAEVAKDGSGLLVGTMLVRMLDV